MNARNQALSQRWFQEVWNERRGTVIEDLMSPDAVGHMELGDLQGVEPFKRVREEFLSALPDLQFEIEDLVSDGDDVVVRWRAQDTHTGDGLGLSPTNQKVTVRGMTWHRFRDGVMIEGWDHWNQEALLQRLREGTDEERDRGLERRRALSERLRDVRVTLFGGHGGPEMARRLGLPARTWYGYETGTIVPAEVLLDVLDQTGVDSHWLSTGQGPIFRCDPAGSRLSPLVLIRLGLERLEQSTCGEPLRGEEEGGAVSVPAAALLSPLTQSDDSSSPPSSDESKPGGEPNDSRLAVIELLRRGLENLERPVHDDRRGSGESPSC